MNYLFNLYYLTNFISMKRLFLLAAAIIMVTSQMLAASDAINCRGRVLDEKGEPVICVLGLCYKACFRNCDAINS